MRKRIGIFGGSFNPPHKGHVEICRYLLNNNVDEVWVLPCFKHPFAKDLISFKDRFTMCKLAFGKFGHRVKVLDIEKRAGGTSHTIKVVKYLLENYPEYKFYLIVGSDIEKEAATWKDADKIHSLVQSITIPRGEKSPIPNISSTEVRRRILEGKKITDLILQKVAAYITRHSLYS